MIWTGLLCSYEHMVRLSLGSKLIPSISWNSWTAQSVPSVNCFCHVEVYIDLKENWPGFCEILLMFFAQSLFLDHCLLCSPSFCFRSILCQPTPLKPLIFLSATRLKKTLLKIYQESSTAAYSLRLHYKFKAGKLAKTQNFRWTCQNSNGTE